MNSKCRSPVEVATEGPLPPPLTVPAQEEPLTMALAAQVDALVQALGVQAGLQVAAAIR